MKVALMGTRGVPARYGGFETAVEEIGAGLVELGHEVTVYCRDTTSSAPTHRGMKRVVLPALRRRSLETFSHSGLSTLHALRHRPDVALVFNAANAPWVAALRAGGIPVGLHVDGHDGRRAKWKGAGQRYYSLATRLGIRIATVTTVDSVAIKSEMDALYGVDTTFIAYGASATTSSDDEIARALGELGLKPGGYHLLVARFEPENQVRELIDGYTASAARLPLVVVGFAGYPGPYATAVDVAAARDDRVRLLGAVWEQHRLDALYAGAASYLHGHSVGGTNPSLLRAMAHGTAVIAYDCPYNRETTGDAALWFDEPSRVGALLESVEARPDDAADVADRARKRVDDQYRWDDVVARYDDLIRRLAGRAAKTPSAAAHAA
jgi:glycosyltransferase involved in cell wall biosynthesis